MSSQVSGTPHVDPCSAREGGEDRALWEFVPLSAYAVPVLSVGSAVARGVTAFRNFFRRPADRDETPVKEEADLHHPSPRRMSTLVRPLPWDDATRALSVALDDWPGTTEPGRACMVVGQPFAGHAELLTLFARLRGATLVPAPSMDQIFDTDSDWFAAWPRAGTPWVLPCLEACFLRHVRGLGLVRQLLSLVAEGGLGPGVLGCDSWSWAYLRRVAPVSCRELTLQAFDAQRLRCLFAAMVAPRAAGSVHFCNAANGRDIFSVPSEQKTPPEEFFQLAAYCRGNVALAAHTWRGRLRSEPDSDGAARDGEVSGASDGQTPEDRVWVTDMPPDPVLPTGDGEETRLALHAALIHGGMRQDLVAELLPWATWKSAALLHRLERAGLMRNEGNRWLVRESAYAAVRRLLRSHGYLVDDF